jgi:hypothetical protein
METVAKVIVKDDYKLLITFSTGETKLFDARPFLDKGVFSRLKDIEVFRQAFVAFDTVCWPGDLDISPETLYDRSQSFAVMEEVGKYSVVE